MEDSLASRLMRESWTLSGGDLPVFVAMTAIKDLSDVCACEDASLVGPLLTAVLVCCTA